MATFSSWRREPLAELNPNTVTHPSSPRSEEIARMKAISARIPRKAPNLNSPVAEILEPKAVPTLTPTRLQSHYRSKVASVMFPPKTCNLRKTDPKSVNPLLTFSLPASLVDEQGQYSGYFSVATSLPMYGENSRRYSFAVEGASSSSSELLTFSGLGRSSDVVDDLSDSYHEDNENANSNNNDDAEFSELKEMID